MRQLRSSGLSSLTTSLLFLNLIKEKPNRGTFRLGKWWEDEGKVLLFAPRRHTMTTWYALIDRPETCHLLHGPLSSLPQQAKWVTQICLAQATHVPEAENCPFSP